MIHYTDLFNPDQLHDAINNKHITVREHPDLPLRILNYTPKAQYERAWNDCTRACRGLILNQDGEVVARPFAKFFNYGELDVDDVHFDLDAPVSVWDKLDGSLGVVYPTPDGPAVATRGSFTSDQAVWATGWLRSRMPDYRVRYGLTDLVEIIYPGNRIVVDYGGLEALIGLATIDNQTGGVFPPEWPGDIACQFEADTLAEALQLPPRDNAEGIVIHDHAAGRLIKVKQDDYVRLHRIVTGWNDRTVWEWLRDGNDLTQIAQQVPDEFYEWVQATGQTLAGQHQTLVNEANTAYQEAAQHSGGTRKDFALAIKDHPLRAALFMLADGKSIDLWAWDQIRPKGEK